MTGLVYIALYYRPKRLDTKQTAGITKMKVYQFSPWKT